MSIPLEAVEYPWFRMISARESGSYEIQQGDIVENFSILSMIDPDDYPGTTLPLERLDLNLIVLSQSRDLNDGKIDRVVACSLHTLNDFPEDHPMARPGGLEQLRKGNLATFHLLNRCEVSGFERPFRIADFGGVHSIPVALVRKHLARSTHLRLMSPYREHLCQSFARFFMSAGLPADLPPFL
jgi:hypothetical protein